MSTSQLPPDVQVVERGWLSANMVVLKSPDGHAVIDSGYVSHAAQTVSLVQSALGAEPLSWLLNSHLHSDHCGGNAALQARYPGLKIRIPPGQAREVTSWDEQALSFVATGQLCPRFGFHGLLQPGTEIQLAGRPWQIHAAGGHDPHSVIFFEAQSRCLISADALWESGFGVVFPELEGEEAYSEVSHTLDVIEALNPKTVVPGHGPVFSYTPPVLARARSRLASFVAEPARHAKYAAKVLLKFKLLEVQQQNLDAFFAWASATPYLRLVHLRYFSRDDFNAWVHRLCADLVKSQAARMDKDNIFNA